MKLYLCCSAAVSAAPTDSSLSLLSPTHCPTVTVTAAHHHHRHGRCRHRRHHHHHRRRHRHHRRRHHCHQHVAIRLKLTCTWSCWIIRTARCFIRQELSTRWRKQRNATIIIRRCIPTSSDILDNILWIIRWGSLNDQVGSLNYHVGQCVIILMNNQHSRLHIATCVQILSFISWSHLSKKHQISNSNNLRLHQLQGAFSSGLLLSIVYTLAFGLCISLWTESISLWIEWETNWHPAVFNRQLLVNMSEQLISTLSSS